MRGAPAVRVWRRVPPPVGVSPGPGSAPPPGRVTARDRPHRGSCRDRSAQRPRPRLRRSWWCRRPRLRRSWSCIDHISDGRGGVSSTTSPTVVVVLSTASPTVVVVSSTTPPAVVVVSSTTHPRSSGEHGSAAATGAATTSPETRRRSTRSACGAPSAPSSFPSQPSTSWGSTSVCDISRSPPKCCAEADNVECAPSASGRAIPPMSVGRSAYVAPIRAESRRNRHGG